MRRRRRAALAGAVTSAVLAVGVAGVGVVGAAVHRPHARSGSAAELVDQAVGAMAHSTYAVHAADLDLVVGPDAGGGRLRSGNSNETVVGSGADLYLRADAIGWTTLIDASHQYDALDKSALSATLAGGWVHARADTPGLLELIDSTSTPAFVHTLVGDGTLRRQRPTQWHGLDVVPVTDTANGGEVLYLTARGAPGIVGATGGAHGPTTIRRVGPAALPAIPSHATELDLAEDGFLEQALVDNLRASGQLTCTGALTLQPGGTTVVPANDHSEARVRLAGTITNASAVTVELGAVVLDAAFPPASGYSEVRYAAAAVPGDDVRLAPGASAPWQLDVAAFDGGALPVPTVQPLGFVPTDGPDPTGAPLGLGTTVPLEAACALGS